MSLLFCFFTFYYVFQIQKNVTFYVFCFVAYVFLNNEYCSILYHLSSYLTLNNRDLEIWVIGHWTSFQSVTSRRPSEIVLSLVCSGTVQMWWMTNAKSVADHSWHVVRRLQSSVIHTKTHCRAPAGSSRLSMLHFGEG